MILCGIEVRHYNFDKDGKHYEGDKTTFHFQYEDENTAGYKVLSKDADKNCKYDYDMIGKEVVTLYTSNDKYAKIGKLEII